MVELIKGQSKKNIHILVQKLISHEIIEFLINFITFKSNVLILMLYSGGVRLGLKNMHDLPS